MIRGVHHIAIKSRDVDKVAAFYRDVLGLRESARHLDDARDLRSIWLESEGTLIMIERRTGDVQPPSDSGLFLLAFRIPPLERNAWKAKLQAAGHAISQETQYTIYTSDPEGNRVGLSSHPEVSGP
jgi:catechol-2,3-dioxygenase